MYFEDIKIGDQIIIPAVTIDSDEMIGFSKKYNGSAMHVDPEYASKSKVGQITSSGIYTFALMMGYYAPRNFCGEQEIAGTYVNLSYKGAVVAGDSIRGVVTVYDKKERNPYNGAIYMRMEVYNQRDEVVLIAEMDDIAKKKCIK